jgi:CRP/FNR family transcriptional regulator
MSEKSRKTTIDSHANAWKAGIFSNLSTEQAAALENHRSAVIYPKNTSVFTEGTYPKGVFYISRGKVKIYAVGNEGKAHIIHIAKAGEVIGFRAMFSEDVYKVSASALEEAEIDFIERSEFMKMMDDNRELRNAVIRELAKELGDKALFITNLAQKSVRERLAYSLLILEEVYLNEPINLTREDLANFVGTATETLIRLLKEFREEGLIQIQTRKLTILDRARLNKLAGR